MGNHAGFHQTYDRIANSLYIKQLISHLRTYISHCSECQLNQTKRHRSYGDMVPIVSPLIPFHCITMDFIVALPPTKDEELDSLLMITCKFTKRLLLLSGKETYNAKEWADVVIAGLLSRD